MCCLILSAILGLTASSKAMTVWSRPPAEDKPRRACTNLCCSDEEADCAFDEALFLQALCDEDSEDDNTEADPVLDDLFFRRMKQTLHQTSTGPCHDRFLPRYWSPEEEQRVRTIYLGSRRRQWYRKMQNLRFVGFPYCTIMQSSEEVSVTAFEIYFKLIWSKTDATVL